MFVVKSQKFTLTLVIYLALVLVLCLVTPSEAKGYAEANILRRDHVNLKRFVRKRSPIPQRNTESPKVVVPAANPGAAPSTGTASTGTALPLSSSSSSSAASTSESSSSIPSATQSTPASTTAVAAVSSSSSSSTSSTRTSSSTSSSTSQTSLATSSPPASTSQTLNIIGITEDPSTSTGTKAFITHTASVTAAEATETATEKAASTSKTKNMTLTVLIVVASSVGGIAILWTVFRKWKLARSSRFDQRLQPIDWQPTNPDDGFLPTHRRVGSSASSFQSGSGHTDNHAGHGATSDMGHGSSDHGHGGIAPLAPIGGYADLARGPSPQPQMHEASLARGPSMARPNFDYGVPLHHQAGYSAEAYDYEGRAVRF